MNPERLALLPQNGISLDLETELIQPGLITPPMVLGSAAEVKDGKIVGKILSKEDVRKIFLAILRDPRFTLVVFNGTYDINVLIVDFLRVGIDLFPEVFAMYDPDRTMIRGKCNGRVFDPMLAETLHAIAQGHLNRKATGGPLKDGRYSLENVHNEVTGNDNAKANDRFRMSYGMFQDVPIDQLPFEARTYPIDDAVNTLWDALAQAGHMPSHGWIHDWQNINGRVGCAACQQMLSPTATPDCRPLRPRRNLHDLSRQAYFAFAASLGGIWGFKIDHEAVNSLEKKLLDQREANAAPFKAAEIIREDGTENQSVLKKLVAQAYGSRLTCPVCQGTGKVPSPKTEGRTKINCKACDGTCLELSPLVPRSDGGGVAKHHDALQESGDEVLMKYGAQPSKKILSTYIPLMRSARACNFCGEPAAGDYPHKPGCPGDEAGFREVPLLPRPEPIVETGRCAYKRGLHGLPRKGGVRECFMARPGYLLSSEDYTAGELVTLAYTCIKMVGYSKLAEALNGGLDAHLALAGTMTGRDYQAMIALKKAGDKAAADARQAAKAANFGFPGGMAELTFTLRKRSEDGLFTPCPGGPDEHDGVKGFNGLRTCILMAGASYCGFDQFGQNIKVIKYNDTDTAPVCSACLAASKRLREFWFQQWPEMNPKDGFFSKVKQIVKKNGPSGFAEVVQLQTGRIRGGVDFTSGANGFFQGLLADAAKNAYCQIARECFDKTCRVEDSEHMQSKYAGGPSPLYGSRPIMLAHDETIAEHPESVAHDAATRVSEVMVEALRFMCPELSKAVKAEPTLMRRLYKGAEPTYDENKRLIPWEPRLKKAA